MSTQADNVVIQVKYKDVEKTFTGSPEQVWLLLSRFFSDFLPSFETAKNLTLRVDLQKLAKDCEGIIAFSKEGANLLVPRDKLTDNEALGLRLLAGYLGSQLGKLSTDAVSRDELQARLGKDAKIVSTRLGELAKGELAVKVADEKYKITTFGIVQMQKDTLPRIRSKIKH